MIPKFIINDLELSLKGNFCIEGVSYPSGYYCLAKQVVIVVLLVAKYFESNPVIINITGFANKMFACVVASFQFLQFLVVLFSFVTSQL